jgi:hypothetical protein
VTECSISTVEPRTASGVPPSRAVDRPVFKDSFPMASSAADHLTAAGANAFQALAGIAADRLWLRPAGLLSEGWRCRLPSPGSPSL